MRERTEALRRSVAVCSSRSSPFTASPAEADAPRSSSLSDCDAEHAQQ